MARDVLVDRSIELAFKGVADQVQKAFVSTIREQLGRVQQESRPTAFEQTIDGVKGAPVEGVDPYGVASFTFSYMAEVVEFALAVLQATSPVETGAYQGSHNVYIDGVLTPPGGVGMAKSVVIASTLPYSRRIEIRRRNGQPWSRQPQVPLAGVYHAAATTAARKYGSLVAVTFAWVSLAADDPTQSAAGRFPALFLDDRTSLA